MKCLSASTSESRPRAWGAGLLVGVLLSGCQTAPRPAPIRPVSADLDVLVRRHPGWPGVARYDQVLARLDRSARLARAGADRPLTALALPAQAGLLPGAAYTLPPAALAQERGQLAAQQRAQIERLRRRRTQSRLAQIAARLPLWQSDARIRYAQAAGAAQEQYAQRFSDAFTAGGARRVNLTLQINVLQKTVAELSPPGPPTPLLARAKAELAARQALLAGLEAQQAGTLADLRRRRDADLARAAADRDAYVTRQRAQLEATLTAADEAALDAQRALLRRQTGVLLRQERALAAAAAPAVGTLGALTLRPAAPAAGPSPAYALETAEARLRGQRARWVKFLYDDTRAAAREAARQRGWDVTFGPASLGEPDRTAALAALLAGRVWKT